MNLEPPTHPYAAQLAGQDPIPVLAATAERLQRALAAMNPAQVEAPWCPGKWSPREILAHLADCELAFSFRLRQVLTGSEPRLQPFEQDAWARRYAGYDAASALALFSAARAWNLLLVHGVKPEETTLSGHHPELGPMTFEDILRMMAGHDLNHLPQIESMSANP